MTTPDPMDPWATDGDPVPTETAGFDDLPVKVWFAGRTASAQDGGWLPKLRQNKSTKEEGKFFYTFALGLQVTGAANADHVERWGGFDCFLAPGDKEDPMRPLSGRMTSFLNAVFSPGIGAELSGKEHEAQRSLMRWNHTLQELRKIAAANPEITLASFAEATSNPNHNRGLFYVSLAKKALETQSYPILFKMRQQKKREGDAEGQVRYAADVEELTPATLKARNLTAPAGGAQTPTTPAPAKAEW